MKTLKELQYDFFMYEYNIITTEETYDKKGAREICTLLNLEPFIPSNKMDDARIDEIKTLKERFQIDNDLTNDEIKVLIWQEPTWFDVLVALSYRIEHEVMTDPDEGDRTAKWFWCMIDNLGLRNISLDIDSPEESSIHDAIDRLKDRTYDQNGSGGLFPLKGKKTDQRRVGLWNQAQAWLAQNFI